MDGKSKISQYRERLDTTLACRELTDESTIKTLVKNQLLQSPEYGTRGDLGNLLETRTSELGNFLDMLRSASLDSGEDSRTQSVSDPDWKIKQDNEEYRVMYREGPPGTPFHVLLVEGYVDGPLDACLCVSWETTLYKKWWPQFNYPAFKIMSSQCIRKIGIGEQVSLMRVKVAWPLSAREALLHYYVLEFLQDDMVVVLVKTIDDVERDGSLYGISNDLVPESNGMVRIGLVGGLAIQKVNQKRCYFRTITSMDIKLDFVPPSLINFVSRQLIGSGFKLCQKVVASVAKGNKDFSKALESPMYNRIRETIHAQDSIKVQDPEAIILDEEQSISEANSLNRTSLFSAKCGDHGVLGSENENAQAVTQRYLLDFDKTPSVDHIACEIEEEEFPPESKSEDDTRGYHFPAYKLSENCTGAHKKRIRPRPEVERALGTLDRVIHAVRELKIDASIKSQSESTNLKTVDEHIFSDDNQRDLEVGEQKSIKSPSDEPTTPRKKLGLESGEVDKNLIKKKISTSPESHWAVSNPLTSEGTTTEATFTKSVSDDMVNVRLNANGIHECEVKKKPSATLKVYARRQLFPAGDIQHPGSKAASNLSKAGNLIRDNICTSTGSHCAVSDSSTSEATGEATPANSISNEKVKVGL